MGTDDAPFPLLSLSHAGLHGMAYCWQRAEEEAEEEVEAGQKGHPRGL